jgi:hypothetical protein
LQALSIVGFDQEANNRHYHYLLEVGIASSCPMAPIAPLGRHIIRCAKPLLVNDKRAARLQARGRGVEDDPGHAAAKASYGCRFLG